MRRLDESVGCTIIRRNWALDLFPKTVVAKNTAIFTGFCLRTFPANREMTYFRKRELIRHLSDIHSESSCHIETVCLLSKLSEAKNHISVKVDMDEMDLTAAESKATYQEIQEWVQEKYRFHVTHLNIAQVKRKHGIIERENYNKPKSEDSRQPGCPEEKEQAIEEALKHFQMII